MRVPKVYATDEGSTAPFPPPYTHYEAPCIYVEYLDGLTASDGLLLRNQSPEAIRSLHKQMAQITAQMIGVACPAAGDLGLDPITGKIATGPEQQLGKHVSFQTSKDFYKAICHGLEKCYGDADEPVGGGGGGGGGGGPKSPSLLLQRFLALHTALAPDEYFCIVHDDFGFHNMLINEELKITAIIDLGAVYAAPWSWALKPPAFSDLDILPESRIARYGTRRRGEIQERENYDYWLSELQSALEHQGNVELVREMRRFIEYGGRELVLGLHAYQEADPKLNSAWLEEFASLQIAADCQRSCSETKFPLIVE